MSISEVVCTGRSVVGGDGGAVAIPDRWRAPAPQPVEGVADLGIGDVDQAAAAVDGHTLLRTLPNPLTTDQAARIRAARPAGPEPRPAAEPVRVQRRVSSRGQIMIAGQKIQVGIGHAGTTVTLEDTYGTFRITHDGQIIAEAARTTTKPIARFKARKPERPRGPRHGDGRAASSQLGHSVG